VTEANHQERRPRIAITVGDVAGIGPEVAIQCAAMPEVVHRCTPILYGPAAMIGRIARLLARRPAAEIWDVGAIDPLAVRPGHFNAQTGRASFLAVERAVQDAVAGHVDAVVTGPVQKEAWRQAGIEFSGHTEFLASRLGVQDPCMMLTSREISCVLATIHLPLADVAAALTEAAVLRAIRLGAAAISARNGRPARVTVCGLNPHAGENGLFGHGEEERAISPAIRQAQEEKLLVRGPLPPDTAFTPANRQATDVYVCMYHDQGLIPLKALAFDEAVNVTLGLPIIRTSVDHGTALDLAWQGTASHHSMLAAIHLAVDLADG
jgi:4-hydroxythreonine-4-phosphate dehydrogenase